MDRQRGRLETSPQKRYLKAMVDVVKGGVKEDVIEPKVAQVTESIEDGNSSPRPVLLQSSESSISTLLHPAEAGILQWSQYELSGGGVIVDVVDSSPLETV